MKRWLILLAFVAAFVVLFSVFEGIIRIIGLLVAFPLFFFYCPLIFAGDKKEEKTEEAKREEEGRFGKWY